MHTMCGLRTGKHSEKCGRKGCNEKKSTENNLERYVGDGLNLKMESNERDIEMNGDGCRITLATNRGRIWINGDGCRLRIEKNTGDIEYKGDGGRISLGPDSISTKVHYFGEGGHVNIAGTARSTCEKNFSTSGVTASRKKNNLKDPDDFVECTNIVDNNRTDKRPKRILRNAVKNRTDSLWKSQDCFSTTRKRNSVEF